MRFLITIITLFSYHICVPQSNIHCSEIISDETEIMDLESLFSDDPKTNFFEILKNCKDLDAIDIKLFQKNLIAIFSINILEEEKTLSYKSLLEEYDKMRFSEDYNFIHKNLSELYQYQDIVITEENKEFYKNELLKSPFFSEDDNLDILDEILLSLISSDKNFTYETFFDTLFFSINTYNEAEIADENESYYTILDDYDSTLNRAKELNKPILLFFTGYACVNATKMESFILNKTEIKSIIDEKFIFYAAYVDDRTSLDNNMQYYSNTLQREVVTVGGKNLDLQVSKFKTNTQPYFVIINPNGKIIASEGYIKEVELQRFINFLNSDSN